MPASLREKAARLRELHRAEKPLVLFNAWDAITARIVESLGFPALATTSSGVANAEGYPDGERIPREVMLARVRVIAEAVEIPVTADLEAGYGTSIEDAVSTARGAIAHGVVGLNLEDGTGKRESPLLDPALQAKRIRAMRSAGEALDVPLVINARIDAFHFGTDDEARFRDATERAKVYIAAGADSIFVPFVRDKAMIERLAAAIPAPLNVLAGPGTPDMATLASIGVRRISVGGGPAGHALAAFRDAALEVRDRGTFDFASHRLTHAELSELLSGRRAT